MQTKDIQAIANRMRLEAVRMVYEGGDGHPGPALSIADIVATIGKEEVRARMERIMNVLG